MQKEGIYSLAISPVHTLHGAYQHVPMPHTNTRTLTVSAHFFTPYTTAAYTQPTLHVEVNFKDGYHLRYKHTSGRETRRDERERKSGRESGKARKEKREERERRESCTDFFHSKHHITHTHHKCPCAPFVVLLPNLAVVHGKRVIAACRKYVSFCVITHTHSYTLSLVICFAAF